jgi:hypothetical protein
MEIDIRIIIMKVYIRCCIETDDYEIDDFKNGGLIMVSPIGPDGPRPFISKELPVKSIDKLSNSVTFRHIEG